MRKLWLALFVTLVTVTIALILSSVKPTHSDTQLKNSTAFEWLLLGIYPQRYFKSFSLSVPLLNFLKWSPSCGHGYTLIAPRGVFVWHPAPMIFDEIGSLIWADDRYGDVTDLKVQQYKGENYLTFWTGIQASTFGKGHYVMLDSSYQIFKTVRAAHGFSGDLHEFTITADNTALITIYEVIPADMSDFNIEGQGWIYDSIIQEFDIETGETTFEWSAADYYSIDDGFASPSALAQKGTSPNDAFDFFHVNSATKDSVGNYLISSRYMQSITSIFPNGTIHWILGGKRNQFEDLSGGRATNFRWQHNAIVYETGNANTVLLSLFDNGRADRWSPQAEHSRGLLLSIDLEHKTVALVQEYLSPFNYAAQSQGSSRLLENSNTFLVGWGSIPGYTEYDAQTGELLCDVHVAPSFTDNLGWVTSYRVARTTNWVGRPVTRPCVYLEPEGDLAYVSWNGATEVAKWTLQAASALLRDENSWENISSFTREHFETKLTISNDCPRYIRIAAVDAGGSHLAYTEIIDRIAGRVPRTTLSTKIIRGAASCGAIIVLGLLCLRYNALWVNGYVALKVRVQLGMRRLRVRASGKRSPLDEEVKVQLLWQGIDTDNEVQ